MDLDFKSVKALASPTRIKILNHLLEKEATTTDIADELDKSKSTISDHLSVLTDSNLIDKDEKEGRRRVIYRPTDSAKAIVEGRERKVKFSIASSAITGFLGLFMVSNTLQSSMERARSDSSAMMMQSTEATTNTAQASQITNIEMVLVVLGGGLIVTALMLALYTYILKKLE